MTLLKKITLPLLAALLALPLAAGEIIGGRLYTVPEKIYVNQPFEIHFELEVTFGSEIKDLRLSDFPASSDLIEVGEMETMAADRVMRDKQALTVYRFVAKSRGLQPHAYAFTPTAHCTLVERRNAGFFSHWQSFLKHKQLNAFTFNIHALPEAGRPDSFSGAIGNFKLRGKLSQTAVQPGDIVTLSLELTGKGWLDPSIALPALPASPLFRTYPAKELAREPAHLKTEQTFIPQNTNATEIAAMRFNFFDPATATYKESVAGPFRLTFSSAPAAPKTEEIRVIDTAQPAPADSMSKAVILQRMDATFLQHTIPLLVASAGVLAAFFVFFLLAGTHRQLAAVIALLLLLGSAGTGYLLSSKASRATRQLERRTDVSFAPSHAAAVLFTLPSGTPVVPLEESGAWLRIDASGKRGWIRTDAFESPKTD